MTNIIKLKFIRNGQPHGRDYTYFTPIEVAVDDIVQIESRDGDLVKGIITQVDVSESEIAAFRDKMKTICGLLPMSMQSL